MRQLLLSTVIFLSLACFAQWIPPFGVPAYHDGMSPDKLPALFPYQQLQGDDAAHRYQIRAYKAAGRRPAALYQLPCYCYCDRRHGHGSLHSCFETSHGASCKECMKEALYTDAMLKQHKSIREIRAGLQRGEFRDVKLQDQ